jgi:hypothetical protein
VTVTFRSAEAAQIAVLRGVASALEATLTDGDLPPELKPGVQFSLRVIKAATARISELQDGRES